MQSTPTDAQAWRLSATLLDVACERRGLRRVLLADLNRLINALAVHEHPALAASALDCLTGKPDYPLMSAANIAARLACDARLAGLLGFSPTAAALYRLQRDEPGLDLLAIVHRASAHASTTDLSQLCRLLPAPVPLPLHLSAPEQDFAEPVRASALLPIKPAAAGCVPAASLESGGVHRQPSTEHLHALQAQPKMRVFRAKTALTVEWGSLSRTPVLFFQMAQRLSSQGNFDWSRRINIAVSAQESFEMLQVCLGRTDYCKLQFHGTHRNKSIELKKSVDVTRGFSLLVRLSQPGSGAVLGLAGFDVASLMQLLALSIASKLPVAGNAADVSFLAQTAAMLELKRAS